MVVRECEKVVELSLDKEADYFWFTSWCGFPTYELDFGWGKPVWVSSASPGVQNLIVLMDSVGDIGGIEAWITMDEADMMKFEQEAGNSLVIVKKLLDRLVQLLERIQILKFYVSVYQVAEMEVTSLATFFLSSLCYCF